MDNLSYKAANTKLNKQKKELGLEFLYETGDAVYFCLENEHMTYYLIEDFITGTIVVSDEENNIYPGDRMLNLLKLKI
jgi:hypothetical protein